MQDGRGHRPPGRIQIAVSWVAAAGTMGYLLPWAIATTRGKTSSASIGWLTLLLGWTGVGWIIALVRACAAEEWMSSGTSPRE